MDAQRTLTKQKPSGRRRAKCGAGSPRRPEVGAHEPEQRAEHLRRPFRASRGASTCCPQHSGSQAPGRPELSQCLFAPSSTPVSDMATTHPHAMEDEGEAFLR